VKEQYERKEEGHLNLPRTVSEALAARSDSSSDSDASKKQKNRSIYMTV
jgi:hypothetical protein